MRRAKGFTLVELLMVIAIILILIAILVPAVQGAWQLVLTMQCQANMHQLLVAFHRFATDHNGKMPGNAWDADAYRWDGSLFWNNPEQVPQCGVIFPYVQNEQAYICPTNRHCPAGDLDAGRPPWYDDDPALGNGRLSYAMWSECSGATREFLSGCHTEYRDSEMEVHRISNVILLVEEGGRDYTNPGDGVWRGDNTFAGTHFGGCNVGFVDGRVELWKTYEIDPAGMDAGDVYFIVANPVAGSLTGFPYAGTAADTAFIGWPDTGTDPYTLEDWCADDCPGASPPSW